MHTHGSSYTPDMLTEVAATQALLQAIPLGICTVDPAGQILSLNTEAERLLGWSETACSGMALHDLLACWRVTPGTTQATCPVTQVLSTGRPESAPDGARARAASVGTSGEPAPYRRTGRGGSPHLRQSSHDGAHGAVRFR